MSLDRSSGVAGPAGPTGPTGPTGIGATGPTGPDKSNIDGGNASSVYGGMTGIDGGTA